MNPYWNLDGVTASQHGGVDVNPTSYFSHVEHYVYSQLLRNKFRMFNDNSVILSDGQPC